METCVTPTLIRVDLKQPTPRERASAGSERAFAVRIRSSWQKNNRCPGTSGELQQLLRMDFSHRGSQRRRGSGSVSVSAEGGSVFRSVLGGSAVSRSCCPTGNQRFPTVSFLGTHTRGPSLSLSPCLTLCQSLSSGSVLFN